MTRTKLIICIVLVGSGILISWGILRVSALLRESKAAETAYRGNEADMIGYFEGAKSPEMELDAAKELKVRYSGYTIRAFGASGTEVVPRNPEDYDAIQSVTIGFVGYRDTASRTIMNRETIDVLYGLTRKPLQTTPYENP
jgi:hypothetical protein